MKELSTAPEVRARYRGKPTTFALHDAQLVLARVHGFDSWPKLKAFVNGDTGASRMIKRLWSSRAVAFVTLAVTLAG